MRLSDGDTLDDVIALVEGHSWREPMPDLTRAQWAELMTVIAPAFQSGRPKQRARKSIADKGSQHRARALVAARSNGLCEICALSVAREWHHRKNRSQGGTWAASNGMHLCAADHAWITEHPAEAARTGWTVRSRQDPAEVPVLRRGKWVLLDDEGGVTAVEGSAA